MAISDFRPGDLVLVKDGKGKCEGIGRFTSSNDKEFYLCERDGCEYIYKLNKGYFTFLLTAVTRRTLIERGTTDTIEREKRAAEIAKLYARLDKLTANDEESERFRVLREIYDLERAPIVTDEWSEYIELEESIAAD